MAETRMTFRMHSKTLRFLSGAILAAGISSGLAFQAVGAPQQDQGKAKEDAAYWSHLATMRKSTELIGITVYDRPGHPLGQIADLLVDFSKGREVCALIMPTGGDAINGYIPVPASVLFVAGRMATLTADKTSMAEVPRLLPSVTDPAELGKAAVHSYAYFKLKYGRDNSTATPELWKSSRLVGRKIKTKSGDTFGSLANLMLDLRSGHIYYAIGSVDGTEKKVFAVPTSALVIDREEPSLWLESDRSKVAETSNLDGFFWTSIFDANWGAGVYKTFSQTPNSEPTGEPVEGKADDKVVAAATPAGPSDSEMNSTVMSALSRSGLGNAAYQNVVVMISSGKVTLQGKVKTETVRRKLVSVVEGVAGPGKVNDMLIVGR